MKNQKSNIQKIKSIRKPKTRTSKKQLQKKTYCVGRDKTLDKKLDKLIEKMYDSGYNEVIISGEPATRKKRHSHYDCERTFKNKGKIYTIAFNCNSYFDGREAYNTEEYPHTVTEISD